MPAGWITELNNDRRASERPVLIAQRRLGRSIGRYTIIVAWIVFAISAAMMQLSFAVTLQLVYAGGMERLGRLKWIGWSSSVVEQDWVWIVL